MSNLTNLINTKVLVSGAVILVAAALVIGGTFAFFSDTETSTGNTFVAGALDLKIDNESYAIDYNIPNFVGTPTGAFVFNQNTSWASKDLTTADKFFNFTDLKPGDKGEDTISVTVGNNAWLCAAARITQNTDESCTSSELADDPTCVAPSTTGELASQVNIAFWKDDGDNVFEQGEPAPFLAGPISGLGTAGKIALSDSTGTGPFGNTPIPGGSTTTYIGKAWCFGTMTATPVAAGTGTPATRGTGFTCNGSAVNNAAQTDKLVGDLQFYAVQSRNNGTFTCSQGYTPVWPSGTPTPTVSPTPVPPTPTGGV